jgi:hypothetical protein
MAISYYHIIDRKECDLRKYYSIWLCIISKDITSVAQIAKQNG